MENVKFYRCPICGNIVGVINGDGSRLVCCGKPMEELTANTVDAATEKHVPVYEVNGVLVSAHKFRRNWEIIKENNDGSMSEEEALLCSMVYPGTYTGENVKKLQEFVDKKQYNDERGGRQKWYF